MHVGCILCDFSPGTARAGITLSREELERVSDLAREHGAWLVMDCTYEDFLFSGAQVSDLARVRRHHAVAGGAGAGV